MSENNSNGFFQIKKTKYNLKTRELVTSHAPYLTALKENKPILTICMNVKPWRIIVRSNYT